MEPENDYGNIEYKLKLLCKDDKRREELISQMAYRLNEGSGECIYILGIGDNGELIGIDDENYNLSLENINIFATKNDSVIINISKKEIGNEKGNEKGEPKYIYELKIPL